jgi:hypothetical protein
LAYLHPSATVDVLEQLHTGHEVEITMTQVVAVSPSAPPIRKFDCRNPCQRTVEIGGVPLEE